MEKTYPSTTTTVVRDSRSGQFVTVHGVGALNGRMTITKGLDLTKPIAVQAIKRSKKSKTVPVRP